MKKMNIAAIAVVLFLLVSVAFAAITVKGIRSDMNGTVSTDGDLTAERAYNVLLVGIDREAGLADVMMLARIDLSKSSAFVVQIPRDTYAEYTDASYKKLNGAYSALGAEGLCEFLSDALGVHVDRYVVLGLDNLCAAVDAIGGVDVNLPCDMKYKDAEQGLYIDLKAGVQHLDGELAEQFVRFRSGYVEGDIDRMDAQKIFLAAIAKKIKDEISLPMAYRLLEAADGVETNFSTAELLGVALEAARIDGSNEFRIFNEIVLPIMKPAVAVQMIFSFVSSWNNFFMPALLLTKEKYKTVPIMIANLRSADYSKFDQGKVFMFILLAILPVMVVYTILSKSIIKGVTSGSVKG